MGFLDTSELALQKAGFNTVKAILDALFPAAVSTWTPSWTYSGTSISSVSLINNEYVEFGPFVWMSLYAVFTLTGNGTNVTFSLPVTSTGASVACGVLAASISSTQMGAMARLGTSEVLIRRYDAGNWSAGVRSMNCTAIYWKG